jgi:hypothetical protein
MGEPVEPADRREPPIDRCRCRPRWSIHERYRSMWGRVTSNTGIALSAAHWKYPRRSWR